MTTNTKNKLAPVTHVHNLEHVAMHAMPRHLPPVLDPEPTVYIPRENLAYVETGNSIAGRLLPSLAIEFARGYLTDNHPGLADKRVLIFDRKDRHLHLSDCMHAVKDRHPDFSPQHVNAAIVDNAWELPGDICLFELLDSLDPATGGGGCLIILMEPLVSTTTGREHALIEASEVQGYLRRKGHGLIVLGGLNPFTGDYTLADVQAVPNDGTRAEVRAVPNETSRAWLRVTEPREDREKSPSRRYEVRSEVWSFDGTIAPL